MDDDEFVETSDPEELATLIPDDGRSSNLNGTGSARKNHDSSLYSRPVLETPLKRRKLHHEWTQPPTTASLFETHGLATESAHSPHAKATFTPINHPTASNQLLAAVSPSYPLHEEDTLPQDHRDVVPSQSKESAPQVSSIAQESEDELDVISEPTTSQALHGQEPMVDKGDGLLQDGLHASTTYSEDLVSAVSLFTPPPSSSKGRPMTLQLPWSDPASSPIRSPSLSTKRQSLSLPPSSPPRESALSGTGLNRSSESPRPLPSPDRTKDNLPQNPRAVPDRMSFSAIPNAPQATSDDAEIAAELSRSRYSFRSRKPQQERPYAYDLQLYKGQLQNIPEAIVAAPRQHDHSESGRHRHGHSHENETQDGEFVVPDKELDEGTRHPRRKVREETASTRKITYPASMQMSDDEDLPELPWSLSGNFDKDGLLSAKRKRFPMQMSSLPKARRDLSAVEGSAIVVTKFSGLKVYDHRAAEVTDADDEDENIGPYDKRLELSPSQATSSTIDINAAASTGTEGACHSGDYSLLYDDELPIPDDDSPSSAEPRSPIAPSPSSDEATMLPSDVEDEAEDEEIVVEEREKRKSMKALRRMMPAFMISKFMEPKKNAKVWKKQATPESNSGSDESDSEMIAPGRSKRLRKMYGPSVHLDVQVRGDTDSSDYEEHVGQGASLPVDGSDESPLDYGSSGDDRREGEAIEADWFDQDFSRRYKEHNGHRNEDLIDRMLSRTRSDRAPRVMRTRRRKVRKVNQGGTAPPRNPALDIVIPRASKHGGGKQTRLPFRRVSSTTFQSSSRGADGWDAEDAIDLSGLESPSASQHESENPIHHDLHPERLSKKQKRERAMLKHTYVLPSDGKAVLNGMRKRLRIDVNDGAFHRALAPLQSNNHCHQVKFEAKTPAAWNKGAYLGASRAFVRQKSQPSLRQTVLTEFGEDSLVEDFTYHNRASDTAVPDTRRSELGAPRHIAKLSLDLGVFPIPVGIAFGPRTYIGKQLLRDLLNFIPGSLDATTPSPSSRLGLDMNCDMTTLEFSQCLERLCNVLGEWLTRQQDSDGNQAGDGTDADVKQYELLMHSANQFFVWFLNRADVDDRTQLQEAAEHGIRHLSEVCSSFLMEQNAVNKEKLDKKALSLLWFAIELSSRLLVLQRRAGCNVDSSYWRESVLFTLRSLLAFGFDDILQTITDADSALEEGSLIVKAANVWVCLIHVLSNMKDLAPSAKGEMNVFWSFIMEILNEDNVHFKSDLEASELLWKVMFSLSALSQFSPSGNSTTNVSLPACWTMVTNALNTIRLTHDVSVDLTLSFSALRKRDSYVHLIVSRCYLLSTRWKWSLVGAHVMVDRLVSIFKSRKFSNLLGEESDFPAFLRYSNLQMLKEIRRSDSAFCIFLKLIVLAAQQGDGQVSQGTTGLRRLLSLIIPIGKVPFTRSTPPVKQELSMLYNRFSSIIIAIYLERNANSVKTRVEQARRYVNYADLDWKSKQACIRAVMHICIMVQHLGLSLEEPLKWLEEMTNVLLAEYRKADLHSKESANEATPVGGESKNRIVICLQLLLGCVRRILETSGMDPDAPVALSYPDLAVLSGPWITDIFAVKDLTSIVTTRLEIQKLVQAFLDLRSKVIPPPARSVPAHIQVESQESQEEFGQFELDLNDPALIAALDMNDGTVEVDENREKDSRVAQLMDVHITPAIYRLVIQHFNDPTISRPAQSKIDDCCRDADKWVDCWVGCAAVVVQNNMRDWSHYLSLGPLSWERIADSSLRRHVGLRFMLRLLQCDPSAYKGHQDTFLEVFMVSMSSFRVTLEAEFASLLFSIDGLRHPMFRDLLVRRNIETGDFNFSRLEFLDLRLEILDGIFTSLDGNLARGDDMSLEYVNQKWVGFVLSMLLTMRDIYETHSAETDLRSYGDLCRRILRSLMKAPRLSSQARLAAVVTWGKTHFGIALS